MFQGIRELSAALSDPFGSDEVDFPVNAWLRNLYAFSWAILEDDDLDVTSLYTSLSKTTKEAPLKTPEKVKRILKKASEDGTTKWGKRLKKKHQAYLDKHLLQKTQLMQNTVELESILVKRRPQWAIDEVKYGHLKPPPRALDTEEDFLSDSDADGDSDDS